MKQSIIPFLIGSMLTIGCGHQQELTSTVSKESVAFHDHNIECIEDALLAIYLWDSDDKTTGTTQAYGSFSIEGNVLIFTPDFPLLANTEYALVSLEEKKVIHRFSLPERRSELTVEAIYPSSDTLPENLLRMYIVFSQPMKTSGNLENIRLSDDSGNSVEGAIFNNVYELWDATQKQLTILFDPARVKSDLVANKELGRALKSGERYHLSIDYVEDIFGQKVQSAFTKTFYVSEKDSISPDVGDWIISLPEPDTQEQLVLQFPDAIDWMSILNRIRIIDQNGHLVSGAVSITNNEQVWSFKPAVNWKATDYKLAVDSRLEDPAGNNLNGLFDHKVGSLKNEQEGKVEYVSFTIE